MLIGGAIVADLNRMSGRLYVRISGVLALLYFLHNDACFRSLFYYRIGSIASFLISWYRPGDKYFIISKTLKMKGGFLLAHPYATILNAEFIGENFSCRHCTTLGEKSNGRPQIGDNVTLGANVTIIGNIYIGNNVMVGVSTQLLFSCY